MFFRNFQFKRVCLSASVNESPKAKKWPFLTTSCSKAQNGNKQNYREQTESRNRQCLSMLGLMYIIMAYMQLQQVCAKVTATTLGYKTKKLAHLA